MDIETQNTSQKNDEAAISASILATEASISAKMKQLTQQVRTEVTGVVDKVNAVQDAIVDIKDAVNVKKHVQNSPLKMLAYSAIAGLFAGGVLRGKRPSVPSSSNHIAAAAGPGIFSLLAIGILRPILADIAREFAHKTLTQRNSDSGRETMNGSHSKNHVTH